MSEEQFTKLFKYIVDMDERIQDEFSDVRAEIRAIRKASSAIVAHLDADETETAARDAQFKRLLGWAKKVADKTGAPLPDF